ncbi:MAG TPA: hemolysin family protein [Atribacteraceae bacterium]|nr:hemolysin family protein [Atribacteraceae bacterium]
MEFLGTILLILFLILINAFFAASEIGLISARRSKLKTLREKNPEQVESLNRLLSNPGKLLATIQIGVTMAGFFASAAGAVFLAQRLGDRLQATAYPVISRFGTEIMIVLVTLVISYLSLVLGELLPKRIALSNPEQVSLRVVKTIEFLSRFFKPMVTALSASTDFLSRLIGLSKIEVASVTSEEIKILISEQRMLPLDERRLISQVVDFGNTLAYEVMTPRTDMVCIEENTSLKEVLELSIKSHYSRIPVFFEDLDNIIGFVHIKDLLWYLEDEKKIESRRAREVVRPIHFVPATKKVLNLLRELQQRRVHMAIVLDEYGGTAGLVTTEDLLEELVGEIFDEHDREMPPYRRIGENQFLVDASTPIEDLNELLNLRIPESEQFESLGGLVMELLGKIPEEGESMEINEYTIQVERMNRRRIATVRIIVNRKREGELYGQTDSGS